MREAPFPSPSADPAMAVGQAIQRLAAARLGRGFVPLALLFLAGMGQAFSGSGGLVLALGAPCSAAAMLAHALRTVHAAFGRPRPAWARVAGVLGFVPPAFGLWVLGWLGVRGLAAGGGPISLGSALLLAALGAWTLRAWLKILELRTLAETMIRGLAGGHAGGKEVGG